MQNWILIRDGPWTSYSEVFHGHHKDLVVAEESASCWANPGDD